jgi:hypothetical protein
LQIESSQPLDIAIWLQAVGFNYLPPPVDYNSPGYSDGPAVIFEGSSPDTLFVTQRERIEALYPGEWAGVESSLKTLSEQPEINGRIISVPISIYKDADTMSSNVSNTNVLADKIRDIIQTELNDGSIKYVVIVSGDTIIPYYRVPDETIISNERAYLAGSFLKPGTPLFYSILGGFNLTDDYLVDEEPVPWQGRSLYIPDIAISRLVETPEEIINTAQAFISSNGVLNPSTALVSRFLPGRRTTSC